jgi:hypothetical protein
MESTSLKVLAELEHLALDGEHQACAIGQD